MMKSHIDNFIEQSNVLLNNLVDPQQIKTVQTYDEEAQLECPLKNATNIEEVLDAIEDVEGDIKNEVLYFHFANRGQEAGKSFCAFSNPHDSIMYKINAIAQEDGLVHMISVTIFSSLDYITDTLVCELREKGKTGHFNFAMKKSELLILFMC